MPKLLSLAYGIDRFNRRIGVVLRWVALVMILIAAYTAVGRYLTPYVGVRLAPNVLNEIQWYLFTVIFLMGAAYGLERDIHIRVDIVYARRTAKGRAWIDLMGTLLFLIPFSILMLIVAWPAVANSWAIREVSPDPGGLPRYPIKALILVSFALLVIQGVGETIKQIAIIRGVENVGDPTDPDRQVGEAPSKAGAQAGAQAGTETDAEADAEADAVERDSDGGEG